MRPLGSSGTTMLLESQEGLKRDLPQLAAPLGQAAARISRRVETGKRGGLREEVVYELESQEGLKHWDATPHVQA